MIPIRRWFRWRREVVSDRQATPRAQEAIVVDLAPPVLDPESDREPPTPEPEPEPPSSIAAPPLNAVPDAEELKSRALARLSYFAPAGYNPFHAPPPKLLAASHAAPAAGFTLGTTAGPRSYFAAAPVAILARAPAPQPGVLSAIDPAVLALYLLGREDDGRLDPAWTDLCLRQPEFLARSIKLRNDAIDNWLGGGAAWNLAEFYARALALAGHAGSALLLCHNVARAFARGGTAIRWIKTDRNRGEYFDGARAFTARALNPHGVLRAGPFAEPSVFHLLFSPHVFGAVDSGDWHRYFGSAALAWYIAANAATAAPALTGFGAQWSALLDDAAHQLGAARAWNYANAASFLELARFGRSGDANRRAARVQLAGAVFGLEAASSAAPAGALWRIPAPCGDARADVAAVTIESLDVSGNAVASNRAPAAPVANPRIRESVVQSLLRALPPRAGAAASIQIVATIEEGIACRFAAADWRDPALQPIAESVIDELGWNSLEHAVRRQAALRVAPPAASGQPYLCELDLGEGYHSCPVATGV